MSRLWYAGAILLLSMRVMAADIDATTGLIIAPGWENVRAHCGGCHSHALVTQPAGRPENLVGYDSLDAGLAELVAVSAGHRSADSRLPRCELPAASKPPTRTDTGKPDATGNAARIDPMFRLYSFGDRYSNSN